jgi:hypothetical protein
MSTSPSHNSLTAKTYKDCATAIASHAGSQETKSTAKATFFVGIGAEKRIGVDEINTVCAGDSMEHRLLVQQRLAARSWV